MYFDTVETTAIMYKQSKTSPHNKTKTIRQRSGRGGEGVWQARGAREQQSLHIWIGSFFFGVDGIQLAHSVGEWSFSRSTWYGIHVYPVINLVSGGCWLVTYLALCDCPSHCQRAAPRRGRNNCNLAAKCLFFFVLLICHPT